MPNQTLVDFVKDGLEKGQNREGIKNALESAGWRSDEVNDALGVFADVDFPIAVPRPQPYMPARIAFLYLLFFILLTIVAFSLGNLLFGFVDTIFPDACESEWRVRADERQIRGGISGLIVATPVFFFLGRLLSKKRAKNPELKRSRIRKWLTYLTLVAAGATLVGDAISLVYNLLDGEMTTRFFLKSAIIAAIAGSIFIYFIKDAEKGDEGANS